MRQSCKLARYPARSVARVQAGFALVEVLVSLLLFSLGVLGLVAMQAKASAYSVAAEDRTRAAMLANEIIANLWAQQAHEPSTSTLAAWKARLMDPTVSGLPNVNEQGSKVQFDSATGITTVTIQWKAPSKLSTDAYSQYFTYVVIP